MNFEYTDKNYKTIVVDEVSKIVIHDKDGNRYRIVEDKLGGLEIMAEDGRLVIEPNVSNVIIIKTKE